LLAAIWLSGLELLRSKPHQSFDNSGVQEGLQKDRSDLKAELAIAGAGK
jgi:hypothetical protein